MTRVQSALRLIFFSAWAVLMTALTYILGAPSLKVLRRRLGRSGYWALATVISAGLYALKFNVDPAATGGAGVLEFKILGIAFFSLTVLMGVFDEFEEMGFNFKISTLLTLLINSLLTGAGFALWVYFAGPNWSQTLLSSIENLLKPVMDLNPRIQVNYSDIMIQLPSVAVILWLGAIYVSILLENRLATGEMAPKEKLPSMRPQLAALSLPDVCVWIFIAALLGTFGGFQMRAVEVISVNAMNICLVLFFFQGLAVVSKFFETVRMGTFWQGLFMVLIVVQLFLFVSLLGLLDFWLGFRGRLAKRADALKRET